MTLYFLNEWELYTSDICMSELLPVLDLQSVEGSAQTPLRAEW